MAALERGRDVVISAGTVVEALIVAASGNVADEMVKLIEGLGFDVVTVTAISARQVAAVYGRWGKGVHPAGLNFGTVLHMKLQRRATAACSTSAMALQRPM
jgi:ribonuclease VapC